MPAFLRNLRLRIAAICIAVSPSAAFAQALPMDEAYGDWHVTCARQAAGQRCTLSQVQAGDEGRRVLVAEFSAPADDLVQGIIVLPLGLDLDAGAFLEVKGLSSVQAERFRTCIPAGCILPISLDPAMIAAMRTGGMLRVAAVRDGGQPLAYPLSLNGFGAALDRVAALSKSAVDRP